MSRDRQTSVSGAAQVVGKFISDPSRTKIRFLPEIRDVIRERTRDGIRDVDQSFLKISSTQDGSSWVFRQNSLGQGEFGIYRPLGRGESLESYSPYTPLTDVNAIAEAQRLFSAKYLAAKANDLFNASHPEIAARHDNGGSSSSFSLDNEYILASNGKVFVPGRDNVREVQGEEKDRALLAIQQRANQLEQGILQQRDPQVVADPRDPFQEAADVFRQAQQVASSGVSSAASSQTRRTDQQVQPVLAYDPSSNQAGNVAVAASGQVAAQRQLVELPGLRLEHLDHLAQNLTASRSNMFDVGKFAASSAIMKPNYHAPRDAVQQSGNNLDIKINYDKNSNQFTLGFTNNEGKFEPLTINSSFLPTNMQPEDRLKTVSNMAQGAMAEFKNQMDRGMQTQSAQQGSSWQTRVGAQQQGQASNGLSGSSGRA